jgi:hypothetical protein
VEAAGARILAEATPFADAGLETYLRPRLRWLRLPIRIRTWIAGHKVDALIGDRVSCCRSTAVTTWMPQRSSDIRHDAELRLMGYHVIRISYAQMMFEWPMVQDLIMRAVARAAPRGVSRAQRRRCAPTSDPVAGTLRSSCTSPCEAHGAARRSCTARTLAPRNRDAAGA